MRQTLGYLRADNDKMDVEIRELLASRNRAPESVSRYQSIEEATMLSSRYSNTPVPPHTVQTAQYRENQRVHLESGTYRGYN